MKINFLIPFILAVAIPICMQAQTPMCGADSWRYWMAQHEPSSMVRELQANNLIYQAISRNGGLSASQGTVSIPVVYHIMHNNGPENVPDSVIVASVNELNLRYQNSAPYYDSTGHPVNVQFCLASVDPQGNPTTGITRTVTPLTMFTFPTDDQPLKNQIRWSPDLYYNIWVVAHISGFIDGYSTFPFNAGQSIDGVVIEYLYIANSFLLAHETGHYCGLYHTFQYGCPNGNCLNDGDQVCDTPPDNSSTGFPCMTNSCSTDMQDTSGFNPFTTDMNELPNYMDYTTCPLSFTQGQTTRMETSMSAMRSSLYVSNGCGNNPGVAPPIAGFTAVVSSCNNGEVAISDTVAINGYTSEWDFNNDGQYDTLAHQFTWVFPATGTYTIRQRVTGIGGQDSTSQVVTVYKGSTFNYPIIAYPQSVTDTMLVCEGAQITFDGDPNGVSWMWSTGDTTSSITITADSSLDISLVMTDTTGFAWSSACTSIHMEVYPFNIPNITYEDTVGYLCQGDLITLNITNYIPGVYYWWIYHVSTGWVNTGSHDTSFASYPDPTYGTSYYVTYSNAAGCTSQSSTVILQPQYLPFFNNLQLNVNGYTLSMSGPIANYQWTNFGIPIPGANSTSYTVNSTGCYGLEAYFTSYPACVSTSDTICYEFTGIDNPSTDGFGLYPNPANHHITVSWPVNEIPERIFIMNMLGETVLEKHLSSSGNKKSSAEIDISQIPPGIYMMRLETESGTTLLKWVRSRP